MGQFANQPDFGTSAFDVETTYENDINTNPELSGSILYIGTGGDVQASLLGSPESVVTFKNIPGGTFLPVVIHQLRSGTTAQDIIAIK
jgi:hypothetical protein